ncbi:MAG: Jag N-terminal domain-containing protein [Deltaproteobacteria bacterium]|nr:Jag N-terminal domain-containing protein [Deltaproteobacteria bacterium]
METFNFEGKTTEEAIKNACSQLNVNREEMEIEIIEPGSPGIFGLVGGRKAKIKVSTIKEKPAPVKEERSISDEYIALKEKGTSKEEPGPAIDENAIIIAEDILNKILELIPMENATVNAEQQNGVITMNIVGDKSGLLIGKKGKTLDALQFIVNRIVNKKLEKNIQVVVDSENYRKRREEVLVEMALRMSEKAKRLKKPMVTNLLNPHDRRTIHLALKDDDEIDTRSRGDGIFKKVLIISRK